VIYRELFPKGLTLLDFEHLGEVGLGHITARQELREMISGLGIPGVEPEQKVAPAVMLNLVQHLAKRSRSLKWTAKRRIDGPCFALNILSIRSAS
jgi:hypothetical protein